MQLESEKWSRARALRADEFTAQQIENFWRGLRQGPGCWEWQRSCNTRGYGNFAIGTKAKPRSILAHRAAYALTHGVLPARAYVLHSCDNPPCCNPAHLSLGNHAENMRQCNERDRRPDMRWPNNPNAVLDPATALAIREGYTPLKKMEKRPYREEWARRTGVTERAIRAVVHNESWVLEFGEDAVRKAVL